MVTDAVLDPAAGGQDQPADSRGVTQGVADGGRGPQREADQGGLLELPVVHQVGQGLFLAGLIGPGALGPAPAVLGVVRDVDPVVGGQGGGEVSPNPGAVVDARAVEEHDRRSRPAHDPVVDPTGR